MHIVFSGNFSSVERLSYKIYLCSVRRRLETQKKRIFKNLSHKIGEHVRLNGSDKGLERYGEQERNI